MSCCCCCCWLKHRIIIVLLLILSFNTKQQSFVSIVTNSCCSWKCCFWFIVQIVHIFAVLSCSMQSSIAGETIIPKLSHECHCLALTMGVCVDSVCREPIPNVSERLQRLLLINACTRDCQGKQIIPAKVLSSHCMFSKICWPLAVNQTHIPYVNPPNTEVVW